MLYLKFIALHQQDIQPRLKDRMTCFVTHRWTIAPAKANCTEEHIRLVPHSAWLPWSAPFPSIHRYDYHVALLLALLLRSRLGWDAASNEIDGSKG